MAKPEWGIKRQCQSCGAVFYDMKKDPIACPKCGAVFNPETVLRSRRGRAVVEEDALMSKKTAAVAVDDDIDTAVLPEVEDVAEGEEVFMEDADELESGDDAVTTTRDPDEKDR